MQTIQINQRAAPTIFTTQDGRPFAALIDYDLYLTFQEAITAWYAAHADPATAELLRLHRQAMREIEQDPSQLVTDEELERDISAKVNHVGH